MSDPVNWKKKTVKYALKDGNLSIFGAEESQRSSCYSWLRVFELWISISIISELAVCGGYCLIGQLDNVYTAGVTAIAAGTILVTIMQTMIPDAVQDIRGLTVPITAYGFFVAFAASQYFR